MKVALVTNPNHRNHNQPGHPEHPERVDFTLEYLGKIGLLPMLERMQAVPVEKERLHAVHGGRYIEHVREIDASGGGQLGSDTYIAPGSYDAALTAAGGLVSLIEAIATGSVDRGFALVRPPGHHALRDAGMGFCIFNNVAIAAKAALEEMGLQRVLIVDWDVHHGNGTQNIFYSENRVLYFSTHQYPYYPGSGHWREIGSGRGEGYTLNVPLPEGVGDAGFRQVWQDILWPAAEAFKPDLVLVSAGYDAHWADPLAGLTLSLEGYSFLARQTVRIAEAFAKGRIAVTLEGGYHLDALSQGVANTLYALLGVEDMVDTMGGWAMPEPDVGGLVSQIRAYHPLLSLEDA